MTILNRRKPINYPLPEDVVFSGEVTPTQLIAMEADSFLISGGARHVRDLFIEAWFFNHAGETPILYIHDGNAPLATQFRNLLPDALMIGGNAYYHDYDPMRGLDVEGFFGELISGDTNATGHVSLSYLKSIARMLLINRYEPTLYRLNRYASMDLSAMLERLSRNCDESTLDDINRGMMRSEASVQDTLDYLDLLCAACGEALNTGSMNRGKSIYTVLRDRGVVCVDTGAFANPMAARLIRTQLHFVREANIPYKIIVDVNGGLPDAVVRMITEAGDSRRLGLFTTPNIWISSDGDRGLSQLILSIPQTSLFLPGRNQMVCHVLSKYLDTYWRENRTLMESESMGRSRREFRFMGERNMVQATGTQVHYNRETLLSANELRALPEDAAVLLSVSAPKIIICTIQL